MPWAPAVIAGVSAVVGIAGSLIGGAQQASALQAQAAAQQQQAEQTRQIAAYNAEIQRQNAQVQFQMAQYQAQSNANLAAMNQAAAIANANLAQVQAVGARNQYDQGLLNAQQEEMEAEATRAQGREEARRAREENERKLATIRSRIGATGTTFEGSNLEQLADAARLAEVTVQDMSYVTELQSRKQYRQAEITKWEAGFSLIDEYGFNVQKQNYSNQAVRYGYESQLFEYDTAIAGAQYRIGLNQAKLTELSGKAEANAYEFQAAQSRYSAKASLIGGAFGAVQAGLGGISGVAKAWPKPTGAA
jgi:hypothetical protein